MRDPYSLEAEHGVLGAMFLRPELIDLLSADLAVEDFYYEDNAAIYRGILDLHGAGQPVDIVTIGARIGDLPCGSPAFAYAAEIARNTPSVANAASYAGTVRERRLDRSLIELSVRINDIAYGDQPTADKVAAVQAEAQAVDSQSATSEVIKAEDILDDYIEVLQARADRGEGIDSDRPATILKQQYVIDQAIADIAAGKKFMYAGDWNELVLRAVRSLTLKRLVERYAEYGQVGFLAFLRFGLVLQDTAAIKALVGKTA